MRRFFILVLLTSACIPAAERRARQMEGKYDLGTPGEGWASVSPGSADRAWYSASVQATIYADSNCGTRYRDNRPEDLATELEAGILQRETVRDERPTFHGRTAVQRVLKGRMDGVPVQVAFTVVNEDWCTYDLTYIASPERFDAGWDAYAAVVDGFAPR